MGSGSRVHMLTLRRARSRIAMMLVLLLSWASASSSAAASVTNDHRAIITNGKRRILLSGSIHYPRSTPEMWPDLIQKAKDGGLDVIQTYVFWNGHEASPGKVQFFDRKNNQDPSFLFLSPTRSTSSTSPEAPAGRSCCSDQPLARRLPKSHAGCGCWVPSPLHRRLLSLTAVPDEAIEGKVYARVGLLATSTMAAPSLSASATSGSRGSPLI